MAGKKLVLIGIDGVPCELISDFSNSGIMPNIKRLIERYKLSRINSPLPEVSSVSWTSLMTGMNPGEHGIFGFYDIDRKNYSYIYPDFPSLPVRTIWERIQKENTSIIINLPNTYPARPLNGILVSGFVTVKAEKAIYPKYIFPALQKMNYRFDPDFSLLKVNKNDFLEDLYQVMNIRYEFFKKMVKKDWNLFFFIITETDRINHFFYHSMCDKQSPYHRAFLNFYKRVDEIIGEITENLSQEDIPFIILSDHGFKPIKKEVYLSQYLKEWGFLGLEERYPKDLISLKPDTRIFCLDPSRIYIHLQGKFKKGSIKRMDYKKTREEVKERFLELEIEGEKVIHSIFYKEDLYQGGKYFDNAPDMVLLSNNGFDLKSGLSKKKKFGVHINEGMHSWNNAILIDSYGFNIKDHSFIYEVGKKIEEYFLS